MSNRHNLSSSLPMPYSHFAVIVFYGIVLICTVNDVQYHENNCKRWRRWSCGSVRTPLSRVKTKDKRRQRKCGIRVAGRATETN